jgi:hypothetical protein
MFGGRQVDGWMMLINANQSGGTQFKIPSHIPGPRAPNTV